MNPAATLDSVTATWLSTLDPALAPLPEALSATVNGHQLHDARWIPGTGCRLSYRTGTPSTASGFEAVEVTADGWTHYDYRDDSRLPGLSRAADPTVVGQLLAPVLGETPSACRVEPVRFRSGSRCVLRYDVTTRTGDTSLYAKVFRPERFPETAYRGQQLAGASADPALVPTVTPWPDLQVLLGSAVRGRPVSAALGDPLLPAEERTGLARRLGEVLARFHAVPGVSAPAWTAHDQLASLTEAMTAVHRVDPALAARLLLCLEILSVTVPAPGRQVLSHGSFRASQVIRTAQDHLVTLDTDRLSLSAASRDLGTALAHLSWQGAQRPQLQPVLDGIERALLKGYQDRAGTVDPESLLWWRAVGLLQVAVRRYRRLEIAAWPTVPLLAGAVEELLAAGRARRARDGVTDVLDCTQMTHAIGLALSSVAAGPVRVRSAQVLADAPGRRRVVRYDVDGLQEDGTVPLVGKVFVELGRARLLDQHLHLFAEGPFRDGPLRVPTPVALLPSRHMVLYRSVDGLPLDRVQALEPAVAGARAAAQWLARLHRSSLRLPRQFSLEREQATCRRWATLIAGALPAAAGPARRLAIGWAAAAQGLADDLTAVPIHKDFHAGHVLVGDGVCVLDLDEARLGDPAFDVAHFCTHLEALECAVDGDALRTAFVEEYTAATGGTDPGRQATYAAYTWLKIARQVALGSGPFRSTPSAHRERLVLSALTKGLACLDR
jgi:aminoglycoside phosphotransferase (APT) family kinase protein